MSLRASILTGLAILGLVMLGIWLFAPSVLIEASTMLDRQHLETAVARAGPWGPVFIIALMTLAVVASPIPSAPIALAAGAAYGHLWGTVQVVIGAELGALIAFGLARVLGHDALRRVFGDRVDAGLLGSQTALTATVFASRLMPFVSFDMISYAAGLSRLQAWRFALATFAGIIPASFLLAHFGGEAVSGDIERTTWAVLGLGLVTGVPLIWMAMRKQGGTDDPGRHSG
ncbi:TVP38/TMEM64 family protein [Roseovarius sp.]|uniref:TVP38/TMEM64 family protein n=1 Tax=Roseovarius sp. TaxID=1486281 RepID=UPI003A975FA6